MIYKKTLPWKNLLDIPQGLIDSDKDGVFENLKLPWDGVQNKPFTTEHVLKVQSMKTLLNYGEEYNKSYKLYISSQDDFKNFLLNLQNFEGYEVILAPGDYYIEWDLNNDYGYYMKNACCVFLYIHGDATVSTDPEQFRIHQKFARSVSTYDYTFILDLPRSVMHLWNLSLVVEPDDIAGSTQSFYPWMYGVFNLPDGNLFFEKGHVNYNARSQRWFGTDRAILNAGMYYITFNVNENATFINSEACNGLIIRGYDITVNVATDKTLTMWNWNINTLSYGISQSYSG